MKRQGIVLPLAGAAGIVSGLLGIGGGVILVPVLAGVLGLGQRRAEGTSLVLIIPIAMAGAVLYILRSDIDWVLVTEIACGSVIGAIIGVRLMMKVSARRLRQGFGVYAILVALLMLLW